MPSFNQQLHCAIAVVITNPAPLPLLNGRLEAEGGAVMCSAVPCTVSYLFLEVYLLGRLA